MPLTPEQVEAIAVKAAVAAAEKCTQETVHRAAHEAVKTVALAPDQVSLIIKQTLLEMGVDSTNPLESQKDFLHLRHWRRAGEDLRNKGAITLLTLFITGLVSLIVLGVRGWVSP